MLIFLLTLLPLFNLDQSQITGLLSNAPADTSSLIKGVISDVTKNSSGGLLSIGLILAIWSASNGMTAIMNSFNVAYDVEDNRNGILLKILSVIFTIVLGVVFLVAMALPTMGSVIAHFLFGPLGLDSQVKWIFSLIRVVLPLIIILILFTILYSVAPNVKTKLKSVLPGAIFTSVIWLLGSFAFGFYISNFGNYSKTYGSIAGIIILLIWLYLTSFIIIIVLKLMQSSTKDMSLMDKLLKKQRSTMMIITKTTIMKILLMNINIQLLAKMKTIKSIKILKINMKKMLH